MLMPGSEADETDWSDAVDDDAAEDAEEQDDEPYKSPSASCRMLVESDNDSFFCLCCSICLETLASSCCSTRL